MVVAEDRSLAPLASGTNELRRPHRRVFSEAASGMARRWIQTIVTATRASPSVGEGGKFLRRAAMFASSRLLLLLLPLPTLAGPPP